MVRKLVVVLVAAVVMSLFPAPAGAAAADYCAALTNHQVRFPVGGARHVVFAVAEDYGQNTVAIVECVRRGWRWQPALTTDGRAGRNGFAPPGEKREGDGRTPTGSFTLTEAFGELDPGTALPYRTLRPTGDCWGSTVTDRRYNRYYSGECGPEDEDLSAIMLSGAYRQSVVINYNRPPDSPIVPGHGSAIFLHLRGSGPTAGCISVYEPELLEIMRGLSAGDRMIMGTAAEIFS